MSWSKLGDFWTGDPPPDKWSDLIQEMRNNIYDHRSHVNESAVKANYALQIVNDLIDDLFDKLEEIHPDLPYHHEGLLELEFMAKHLEEIIHEQNVYQVRYTAPNLGEFWSNNT